MSATYDTIADWYDDFIRRKPIYREIVLPGILGLVGDVRDREVCDLACGQGQVARELAIRGARVTGVDVSERLLNLALRYEQENPLGIRYVRDDAQSLSSIADNSFGSVTCGMALMNIPDLSATFRAVRRILKPRGSFVFAITHPCFQSPYSRWVDTGNGAVGREVREYFDEKVWQSDKPDGIRALVGDHHRTLSTYINTLSDAGLLLDRIDEPQASGEYAREVPGTRWIPTVLIARARSMEQGTRRDADNSPTLVD